MKMFKAKLEPEGPGGAWTRMHLPFDVEKEFGSRARVSVKGTMNGFAFSTSIFPNGDGTHHMMVNKKMQVGAKARSGDTVVVELGPDTSSRKVEVPPELAKGLARNKAALAAFEKMPPSHRKEYIDYYLEAKKAETKTRRVAKIIERLLER